MDFSLDFAIEIKYNTYMADSGAYYQKYKEKMIENARRWHFNNPLKRAKTMRAFHYWRRYKITIRIYNKLLRKQNYRCALCRRYRTRFNQYLDVDENPISHLPRGLLCTGCNRIVGRYENLLLVDEKLKQKVEKYLAKYDI